MTITVTSIVAGPYTATGAAQNLPFDFKVFTPEEIEVVVGADRTPVDPSLYTVTRNLAVDGQVLEGGSVSLSPGAVEAGASIRLIAKPFKTQDLYFSDTGSRLRNLNEVADRAALRALRAQYDGAMEGAGQELLEAAIEAGAAAGAEAAQGKANKDASGMTDPQAQAWLSRLDALSVTGDNIPLPSEDAPSGALILRNRQNQFFVTLEDFGGVANDPSFDNAPAVARAEAYLTASTEGGSLMFGEGRDYYFKSTLTGVRNRLAWTGMRSRLIYNGASGTTILLDFGNGTNQIREVEVSGIELCTLTNMSTPSVAVRVRRAVRSNFRFDNIQGQDWQEANPTARLWHGVWFDQVDNTRIYADAINARGDGLRVNGAVGTSGPKADLWVHIGKISGGQNGIVMGGGFGGLYLGPTVTLINNDVNLRVDQSLCAEQNRELFCTGTIFDVAKSASTANANIIFDDPGDLRTNMTGCWISAGQSHGIWQKRSNGKLAIVGGRIIGNKGDAFRTDVAGSGFTLLCGVQISDNTGWAVNGRINGHSVIVDACWFAANTLGMVNTEFTNNGMSRNEAAQFPIVHTVKIQGDTGDYLQYNRAGNLWESFNGNVSNVAWGVNAFRVGAANPFVRYAEFALASAPSGAISITHGDANMWRKGCVVQGWYNDGGVARALTLESIGPANFNFAANANAVGKPAIAFVWFLDAQRSW